MVHRTVTLLLANLFELASNVLEDVINPFGLLWCQRKRIRNDDTEVLKLAVKLSYFNGLLTPLAGYLHEPIYRRTKDCGPEGPQDYWVIRWSTPS